MTLPDIKQKKRALLEDYLGLIGYMAQIDDDLDEKEKALLGKMAMRFGFSSQDTEKFLQGQSYSDKKIKAIYKKLTQADLHYSFLLDLISMALADGVIMDKEQLMLAKIANWMDLASQDFHNLIYFAQTTSSMAGDQPMDPMCGYVIDQLLAWLKINQVILYQQTTLAPDEKIDQSLKAKL